MIIEKSRETSLMTFLKDEDKIVQKLNASTDYIEGLERAFKFAPAEEKPALNVMIGREKANRAEIRSCLECCRAEIKQLIDELVI